MNGRESAFVDKELIRLQKLNVVQKLPDKPKGVWVSNIFLCPKKDGSFRLILNLKPLNKLMPYKKFKMDGTENDALRMMTQHCFMISIDLQMAYFHVFINHCFHKYCCAFSE